MWRVGNVELRVSRRVCDKAYPSMVSWQSPIRNALRGVANTGSTARDQLANERTFLAFTRTGTSFVGAGIALWTAYCFGYDPDTPQSVHPAAVAPAIGGFIFNGALLLSYSMVRYMRVQKALLRGEFLLANRMLFAVITVCVSVTVAALYDIFLVEMSAKGTSIEQTVTIMQQRRKHRHGGDH